MKESPACITESPGCWKASAATPLSELQAPLCCCCCCRCCRCCESDCACGLGAAAAGGWPVQAAPAAAPAAEGGYHSTSVRPAAPARRSQARRGRGAPGASPPPRPCSDAVVDRNCRGRSELMRLAKCNLQHAGGAIFAWSALQRPNSACSLAAAAGRCHGQPQQHRHAESHNVHNSCSHPQNSGLRRVEQHKTDVSIEIYEMRLAKAAAPCWRSCPAASQTCNPRRSTPQTPSRRPPWGRLQPPQRRPHCRLPRACRPPGCQSRAAAHPPGTSVARLAVAMPPLGACSTQATQVSIRNNLKEVPERVCKKFAKVGQQHAVQEHAVPTDSCAAGGR